MKRFLLLLIIVLSVFPAPVFSMESMDSVYIAASILHGEAADSNEKGRELTACSIVRDMARGVDLRARWYGWRAARPVDIALIERARDTDLCRQYPHCRFTGNGHDLEVWARKGWVKNDVRVIAYCGSGGCSVCVPLPTPLTRPDSIKVRYE